jgi:hypothetical protein
VPAERHEGRRVEAVLAGVAWVQLNGTLELGFCLRPVPKPEHDIAQRIVGFGQPFVQSDRFASSVEGLGFAVLWRHGIGNDEEIIGVGQSGIGFCEIRIVIDRLLKMDNRFAIAIHGKLVSEIATAQVGFIGLRIKRERMRGTPVCGIELYPYLFRHCLRHFLLHGDGAAYLTVIAVRPYMRLVSRADELDGDAHLIPVAANAALQDVIGAQFSGNLLRTLGGALVSHGSGACNHSQLLRA